MKISGRAVILGIVLTGAGMTSAYAQQQVIFQDAPVPAATAPSSGYTDQQLDQLLAPVALYPDALLGDVLMASTYPLEVVEANRWLQNPQNAALKGDQLAAALEQQPWDPSVKSLVGFPQTLAMMDNNLQWTEQLGDAFIADQGAVMDHVQHLRQMAQASGHLASNTQETVSVQEGAILIEPATPTTVYIPYYNPSVVYGPWPYPEYQPYYFPAPPGYVYYNTGVIGFGVGIVIADALWGWNHWDWHHHHLDIDDRRWEHLDEGHRPPPNAGIWRHDPDHRHGVPYRSPAARAQFGAAQTQLRANYRGFAPHATTPTNTPASTPAATFQGNHTGFGHNTRSSASPHIDAHTATPQTQTPAPMPQNSNLTTSHQPPAQFRHENRQAPVFESFSRGQDVHTQSQRGAASLATMHASPQERPQPMPHGATPLGHPEHGGDRGGDHGGPDRH